MNEPRVGSARIVRCDALNIAVEVYKAIEVREKQEDGTMPKTGAVAHRWEESGYYGHRLDHAAESALFQSMPHGEQITPKMIRDAIAEIVANTKAISDNTQLER